MITKMKAVKEKLYHIFTDYLKLQPGDMNEATYFSELGVGSVNAVELTEMINVSFNLKLPTSIIFEFRNLIELSQYIVENFTLVEEVVQSEMKDRALKEEPAQAQKLEHHVAKEKIAIIGLSCRCAKANNQQEFWDAITNKKECVQEINEEKWVDYLKDVAHIDHKMSYGKMDDIAQFDSLFFNISPAEANAMDPAQRILLEECYRALQDANCSLASIKGKEVGTIIGTMGTSTPPKDDTHYSMLGYDSSILAARIAYFLDLKGATMAVNTACSSALVAIDLACNQLMSGSIDMAISGGINIYAHPKAFVSMENAGMLSKTQSCKPFDQGADGIVVGDGVGIVILKRLSDAIRDQDYIYGVIDGIGINQDGATNGITVPSFQAQCALERKIYEKYEINVEDIQYIEAHGTATKLGDPIKVQALTQAFRTFTKEKQYCAIGSVKANIGHTAAAAGALSLIKVLLSMKYKKMVPSIHYHQTNEQIDFENSPFYVNTELKEWPVNEKGRRVAAISAFGLSGTNAHMVIEDYDNSNALVATHEEKGIFAISSHTKATLQEYCLKMSHYIAEKTEVALQDIAYSLMIGREQFKHRFIATYETKEELLRKLNEFISQTSNAHYNDISKVKTLNLLDTEEGKIFIRQLLINKKYEKLAELWLYGSELNWEDLFESSKVHKIAGLPEYVFCKNRCYVPMDDEVVIPSMKETVVLPVSDMQKQEVAPERSIGHQPQAKDKIRSILAEILQIQEDCIDDADAFMEFGLDSISGMKLVKQINETFDTEITFRTITEYNTVESLSEFINTQVTKEVIVEENQKLSCQDELSISQKGIWVVHQMFPKDASYNIINAFKFNQNLNQTLLQKAFDVIVKENPLLSSKVGVKDGEPYLIQTKQNLPIQVIDCTQLSQEEVHALIEEKAILPFALDEAPLMRVYLLETSNMENILVTVAHHLIFDGKSLMIVIKELLELYTLGVTNQPMKLQKSKKDYQSFVRWQKQYLSSPSALKDRAYWLHQLGGELPTLHLEGVQNLNKEGKRITKKVFGILPDELSMKINEVSKRENVSNFVLLLSAFNMMLHKISQQQDVIVGTVLEGRPKKEFEDVVGCFMNVAAFRSRIDTQMSYRQYFEQVKEDVLDMIEHGNYPFSEVVNQLATTNMRGESPLFDVTFILHNWFDMKQLATEHTNASDFLHVEHLNDIYQGSMYDLLVEVFVNNGQYEVSFKYNGYRFNDATIQHLLNDYVNVLDALIHDGTLTLNKLTLQNDEPKEIQEAVQDVKSTLEDKIVAVYQEVLQKSTIDKHKNFFEMGGNSMKLVKATLKLKEQLQINLEPTDLFAHPTVYKLANYLNQDKQQSPVLSRSKRRGLQRREIISKLSI